MPAPTVKTPFPLLADMAHRRRGELVESAKHVEEAGYRIAGLSQMVVQRQVKSQRDEAEFFGEIYKILIGLAPIEATVRAVLEM